MEKLSSLYDIGATVINTSGILPVPGETLFQGSHVAFIAAHEGGETSDLCGDKNVGLQIELRQLTIVNNPCSHLRVRRGC